jgi:hypothetical protein
MEKKDRHWKGLQFAIREVDEDLFKAATKCEMSNGKRLKFWVNQWIDAWPLC